MGGGDAYVKFWEHELDTDEDAVKHWVFKRTAWDHLDVVGTTVRLRAGKTVACLDNCTLAVNCNMKTLSKNQACMMSCKFDDCQKEDECKALLHEYVRCKE